MRVRVLLAMALLCTAVATQAQGPGNPPGGGPMTPEMRQQMMAMIQDILIMSQNTAVTTTQGVLVLQGNRLLDYTNTLQLRRTVVLPVPPAPAAGAPARPLRSMVPAKLLPQTNGELIVVRGQQIIRLDRDLKVINQATLPDLPPLTTAEIAVVAPIGMSMMMMMPGMGMPGMPMTPPPPGGGMPGAGAPQ